jgi:coproporphyrinogen III oxidase
MLQRSNRTFRRIVASLPRDVAYRYGYVDDALSDTENRLRMAVEGKDWVLASRLAAELAEKRSGNA